MRRCLVILIGFFIILKEAPCYSSPIKENEFEVEPFDRRRGEAIAQAGLSISIQKERALWDLSEEDFYSVLPFALRDKLMENAQFSENVLNFVPQLKGTQRDSLSVNEFNAAYARAMGFKTQAQKLEKYSSPATQPISASSRLPGPLSSQIGNSGCVEKSKSERSHTSTFRQGAAIGTAFGVFLTVSLFCLTKSKGG